MLILDIFRRYFFSKRAGALVRSLARLCLVGNAISVTALILVSSIMNGFNHSQSEKLLAVEPHLVITGAEAENRFTEFLNGAKGVDAREVDEIAPFESQDVIIRTLDGAFSGGVAKGVMPVPLNQLLKRAADSQEEQKSDNDHGDLTGQPVDVLERMGPGEVLIGAELAANLGLYQGDEVILVAPEGLLMPAGEIPPYAKVKIASTLNTGIANIDSQMLYYDRTSSLKSLKTAASRELGIEVRLKDPHRQDVWVKKLREAGFEVSSWAERNSSLFFALKMEKIAMSSFLALTILITSFSLITVIVMLLTQKRQEIGVLMALGLSKRRAQILFQGVGFLLSSSGMLIGLILGLALAFLLQATNFPILPEIYTDRRLPSVVDFSQIGFITLGLFALAFLASWLPVKGSLELTPSEAIRGFKRGR